MGIKRTADLVYVIRIISILTTPWESQDAFKLGIIDGEGNVLRKFTSLTTNEEKDAYTYLHRLVFNLKRLLNKFPGGKSVVASAAASFLLLKESIDLSDEEMAYVESKFFHEASKNFINEDSPTNATGSSVSTNVPTGTGPMVRRSWKGIEKFCDSPVFSLDQEDWAKFRLGKKKNSRWENYFPEDSEVGNDIRAYAKTYPKTPIIVKEKRSGAMQYLKYK